MPVKFGLSEIGKPAPVWMDRTWTALTMFIFPACAAFMLALPPDVLSEHNKNLLGAAGTFFLSVFKGLKFLFSNDQTPAGNGTS